jgi:hypothetical protein
LLLSPVEFLARNLPNNNYALDQAELSALYTPFFPLERHYFRLRLTDMTVGLFSHSGFGYGYLSLHFFGNQYRQSSGLALLTDN